MHPVKRAVLLFLVVCAAASAQTNLAPPTARTESNLNSASNVTQNAEVLAAAQHIEELRAQCIQERRLICGKILKVLPEGLVVDSGYSSLLQTPPNGTWLLPGTVVATRDTNVVERAQPDAICLGQVFLTDLPKSKGAKPKQFDYVKLEGFRIGQYTYTSVGDVHRTVRKFSCKLGNAVRWKFEEGEKQAAPVK